MCLIAPHRCRVNQTRGGISRGKKEKKKEKKRKKRKKNHRVKRAGHSVVENDAFRGNGKPIMPLLGRAGGRGWELRLLIEAKRVNINLLVKRREITERKLKKRGPKGSPPVKSLCTSPVSPGARAAIRQPRSLWRPSPRAVDGGKRRYLPCWPPSRRSPASLEDSRGRPANQSADINTEFLSEPIRFSSR